MRVIKEEAIAKAVAQLCLRANLILRKDVLRGLRRALAAEKNRRAKKVLQAMIENARLAKKERLAICQDTGLPVVFLEIGRDARLAGDINAAVQRGVEAGYRLGCLRNSMVKDPLLRGRPGFKPALIHTEIVSGNKLKITFLPKGSGCENKTQLKMFKPTADLKEIKDFIVQAVKNAGPDACPPYVVGVGIGGTADYACLLAKKALIRNLYAKRYALYAKLELDLLKAINKLNIGPMGLGGRTTALAVNIEAFPTHITLLPVCVNISCYALRSASKLVHGS